MSALHILIFLNINTCGLSFTRYLSLSLLNFMPNLYTSGKAQRVGTLGDVMDAKVVE